MDFFTSKYESVMIYSNSLPSRLLFPALRGLNMHIALECSKASRHSLLKWTSSDVFILCLHLLIILKASQKGGIHR